MLTEMPSRKYYQRNNELIQQYMFIDRVLDSSIPHHLIQEYQPPNVNIPDTITEESNGSTRSSDTLAEIPAAQRLEADRNEASGVKKVKRTPRNIYKLPDEETPLLENQVEDEAQDSESVKDVPILADDEEYDSQSRIVKLAIYVNLLANTLLLILKIVVTVMTSSVSVLASLVDAALDFLSSGIVWVTTRVMSRRDRYQYPVGRSRLEPISVLVFSIIMITSFFQVAIEGITRMAGDDHRIIALTISAIAIMVATVVVKGICWIWCRLIPNSSVQMLAEDAKTDVVFNCASIVFPLGE
jgi:hypothetical protein